MTSTREIRETGGWIWKPEDLQEYRENLVIKYQEMLDTDEGLTLCEVCEALGISKTQLHHYKSAESVNKLFKRKRRRVVLPPENLVELEKMVKMIFKNHKKKR